MTAARACPLSSPRALTPTDVDLDGVRDYWAVCGAPGDPPTTLLRGLGDGRFELSTLPAMSPSNAMRAGLPVFSMLADDLDDDGVVDAVLLSDNGTGWFGWGQAGAVGQYSVDEPMSQVLNSIGAMGAVSLDYDRDGRLDTFWAGTLPGNVLYRHAGGREFTDDAERAGVRGDPVEFAAGMTSWSAVALDVDLDGWDDLLVLRVAGQPWDPSGERPARPSVFVNQHDGTFLDVGDRVATMTLTSKQAACGDLAGDGRVGCVLTDEGRVLILRNRVENAGGWLGVRLRGTVSDPEGIGAVVSIEGLDRPLRARVGPHAATWAHHRPRPRIRVPRGTRGDGEGPLAERPGAGRPGGADGHVHHDRRAAGDRALRAVRAGRRGDARRGARLARPRGRRRRDDRSARRGQLGGSAPSAQNAEPSSSWAIATAGG